MRNLIRANFIRYMRRVHTIAALLISFGLGVYHTVISVRLIEMNNGESYYYFKTEFTMSIFLMFMAAIVSVLNLGSEFNSGAVRNKLIAGYIKVQIFVSELILSWVYTCIFCFLFYMPFLVVRMQYLTFGNSFGRLLIVLTLITLSIIAVTTITVFICFWIKNHIAAAIFSLMIIVMMVLIRDDVNRYLQKPHYYADITFEDGHVESWQVGNGDNTENEGVRFPEGSTIKYRENPGYVDGAARVLLTVMDEANPYNALNDSSLGISGYRIGVEDTLTDKQKDLLEKEKGNISDKCKREVAYNAGLIVIFSVLGILVFRKRNIK